MAMFIKKYIYDYVIRILHWGIAMSSVFLIVTGLYAERLEPGAHQAALWVLHIQCGKVLTVSFIARLVWGVAGTNTSSFRQFWHPSVWLKAIRTWRYRFDEEKFGHDPFASLSYIYFYSALLLVVISGWTLAGMIHAIGPLADELFDDLQYQPTVLEIHEWGFWLIVVFIVLHIGALIFHEKFHGVPVAQSMISGYQFRKQKEVNSDD